MLRIHRIVPSQKLRISGILFFITLNWMIVMLTHFKAPIVDVRSGGDIISNSHPNAHVNVKTSGPYLNTNSSTRNFQDQSYMNVLVRHAHRKTVTKVLLLAYSRGGSTFLGQLFAINPESFYWFEILQPMYLAMSGMMAIPTMELYDSKGHRRQQTDLELGFIVDNLDKYFSCRLNEMPDEMFNQDSIDLSGPEWEPFTGCMKKETGHQTQYHINKCLSELSQDCRFNAGTAYDTGCFHAKAIFDGRLQMSSHNSTVQKHVLESMSQYDKCLSNSPLGKAVKKCWPRLVDQCNKTEIRAAKVLRMRLSDTEALVKQHPDLKIIHQIRDPRGALLSSKKAGIIAKSSRGKFTNEAKLVCPKMLEDLQALAYLKEEYPNNYLQIKYEDNAADPVKMMHTIYDFLGVDVPKILEDKVFNMTHSKRDKHGVFSTQRQNSNATAHKWRSSIKPQDKIIVDRVCDQVLHFANYRI